MPKTVEDDGVPEDVHILAMGFDGELIFGCKLVQLIQTSHVPVVGTNNVRPLNFNIVIFCTGPAKDDTRVTVLLSNHLTAQML